MNKELRIKELKANTKAEPNNAAKPKEIILAMNLRNTERTTTTMKANIKTPMYLPHPIFLTKAKI